MDAGVVGKPNTSLLLMLLLVLLLARQQRWVQHLCRRRERLLGEEPAGDGLAGWRELLLLQLLSLVLLGGKGADVKSAGRALSRCGRVVAAHCWWRLHGVTEANGVAEHCHVWRHCAWPPFIPITTTTTTTLPPPPKVTIPFFRRCAAVAAAGRRGIPLRKAVA